MAMGDSLAGVAMNIGCLGVDDGWPSAVVAMNDAGVAVSAIISVVYAGTEIDGGSPTFAAFTCSTNL